MRMNQSITRRHFVLGSAALGAAAALPKASAQSANNEVRMGVIGCGNRGKAHVGWIGRTEGARVVAVSDPDTRRMDKAVNKAKSSGVKKYQDYRQLLADDSIDAVAVATPNFWHALHMIEACQAGKHVYVEKPANHNIWEGRKMIEAANKYDRIVQVGTQQRSDPALITLREELAEKKLGEVEWIHSLWYANRGSIGNVQEPQPVDKHIDYNLWVGPRPHEPVRRKQFHYDWHWFWKYGNGDMGNRVIHNIDDIHHVMRMHENLPDRAMAVGGRFKYDDDANTPNTELIVMNWQDIPIIFGSRNMSLIHPRTGEKRNSASIYQRFGHSHRFTNLIKCEKGVYAVTRGGGVVYDNDGKQQRSVKGDGGGDHMPNFIKAVQKGDKSILNAPIEEGHRSATMLHHGNISYRIGGPASPDEVTSRVAKWEEAKHAWDSTVAHLERHDVDLGKEKPTLGPWLTFDAKAERFTGDHAEMANMLVRETYRRPFVVPEQV